MRVSVIDNEFVATMRRELKCAFDAGGTAKCATAFMTEVAVDFLGSVLASAQRHGRRLHVQLVVGLYGRITPPSVLPRLRALQQRYAAQLEVRVARNERFHWKLYLFKTSRQRICYVGSSNFTGDGLEKNGELNLRLSNDRAAFGQFSRAFDDLWKKHTVEIKPLLARYHLYKRQPLLTSGSDSRLKSVLESAKRGTSEGVSLHRSVGFTYITQPMSRRALRIVHEKTNWDDCGWDYMVFERRSDRDRQHRYDSLVVQRMDRARPSLEFCDVKARKDVKTDDGNYFLAFEKVKGSTSKIVTKKLKAQLKLEGCIKKVADLEAERTLGRNQQAGFRRVLRAEL